MNYKFRTILNNKLTRIKVLLGRDLEKHMMRKSKNKSTNL